MNKKIYGFSIGFLCINILMICTNPIMANEENELALNKETYEYGFIVLDCWSIQGLPEDEHVGSVNNVDLKINGLTQGLLFTMPSWGSTILIETKEIHIHMDNFYGLSVSYNCGAGSIIGIGKNIEWEIM